MKQLKVQIENVIQQYSMMYLLKMVSIPRTPTPKDILALCVIKSQLVSNHFLIQQTS